MAALEAVGIQVRAAHGGAKSACPLPGHKHDDRNPSLSIQYIAQHGRTRVRCHLPDHTSRDVDILDVLGLSVADLYDEPKTGRGGSGCSSTSMSSPAPRTKPRATPAKAEPAPRSESGASTSTSARGSAEASKDQPGATAGEEPRPEIVARYDYRDAAGGPLARVLRYEPKAFRQQRWNGSRWVWGAPPAEERVLYRLPQVRAAAEAGAVVHLLEGEKDADAVAAALTDGHGAATTAPMGADKWLPQYTEQLAGASLVVIWRDKDDSGTRQARTVLAALQAADIPALVVEALTGKDAADHLAAGHSLDEAVPVDLEALESVEPASPDAAPAGGRLPAPEHHIPMGRGSWAYEHGGQGRRERGVWNWTDDHGWRRVAPLPFVHARIAQRDGTGRRTATAYLLSAIEDGPRVVVTHEHLRTASWANMLGLALSADDRVTKAATTAIIYAAETVEEREETPRVQGGRISVPCPETLPAGYLQTSPAGEAAAREGWAQLIELVARSPKMALVVGASAIAPFVAASQRQSHFVYLYGDPSQGKSVTLNTAGAIWGLASTSPEDDGPRVVTPWNASPQGPIRVLGELGVLPPLWDEIGQAPYQGAREWGKFIFDVCEGARRITPGQRGAQTHYGRPWRGIFIAAGNGRILEGLGAGRYAGVTRRVVELATPMTLDRDHAEEISRLWRVVYGHAGMALLHDHTAETVRPLLDAAAEALPAPPSAVGATVADHLHAHVAGAALLDRWAGTGTTLRDAAITAAAEYLQAWAEPEHDADRMLGAITDAIAREPAMWPTTAVYQANRAPQPAFGTSDAAQVERILPRHGVDRSLSGLRDDDSAWVAVFAHTWRTVCADLGLDAAVTATELHRRGVLVVPEGRRRRGEWVTQLRATGTGMYKLVLPVVDDEDETPADDTGTPPALPLPEGGNQPELAENTPRSGSRSGSVVGGVVGADRPLTCDVVGVVGVVEPEPHVRARAESPAEPHRAATLPTPQPCVVCRTPAFQAVAGQPVHTGQCLTDLTEGYRRCHTSSVLATTEPQVAHSAAVTESQASTPTRRDGARFQGPAAVVDAGLAYLPAGLVTPVGPLRHVGDLAALVHPERLALGHGGDAERLPDTGQVWLTAATLEALGLPAVLPDEDAARAKALTALNQHPAIAAALENGWQLGQGGHLREWARIWHPEQLRAGAWLVFHPWQRLDKVALLEGDPHPAELVDRLAQFADTVGISYRLSPATTGLDLVDHTRPPAPPGEPGSAKRVAVRRGEPAELPGWLRKVDDPRTRNVEQDWSWWRRWDSLTDDERSAPYLHLYDRNKAYFSSWSGVELGVSGLRHLKGQDATWDGSEKPGFYRITRPEWGHTRLPDPGRHLGYPVSDGTVWASVHTLRMLAAHDITLQVHEAYTWAQTSRYLELAAKRLSPLLASGQSGPVAATVKNLYTNLVGKLGEIDHDPNYHLWRPDWRHLVIGLNKAMILRSISQTGQRTGTYPLLVVGRDTIGYASNEADPAAAWPGRTGDLGPKPGQWKPAGYGDLQTWGPRHLVTRPGRWRMSALTDLTTPVT